MTASKNGILGLCIDLPVPRTPGCLGKNDAADISMPVCLAGDTSGPLGTQGDGATIATPSPEKIRFRPLICDRDATLRFLESVATMVAIDKLTVVQGGAKLPNHNKGPFPTLDQMVITVFAGEMTIDTGDRKQIDAEKSLLMNQYVRQFLTAVAGGGAATGQFYRDKRVAKNLAKKSLDEKFAKVQKYNSVRLAAAQAMVVSAATLQLGSTIVLKTVGNFAPAIGTAIELGYDIVIDAIKDYESAEKANAVVVVINSTIDETVEEAVETALKKFPEKSTEMWDRYVQDLNEELSKRTRQVREKRGNNKKMKGRQKGLTRAQARATQVAGSTRGFEGVAKRSGILKAVGKRVSWAVWLDNTVEDFEEALGDWMEAVESAK
jgi:hypothetical protein